MNSGMVRACMLPQQRHAGKTGTIVSLIGREDERHPFFVLSRKKIWKRGRKKKGSFGTPNGHRQGPLVHVECYQNNRTLERHGQFLWRRLVEEREGQMDLFIFNPRSGDNFFFLCMPQINPHSTAKAVARDRGIGSNRGCEGVWKMVEDVQRREQRIPIANLHLWLVGFF